MVTTYTVLKTIHILAAIYWVGGGAVQQVIGLRVLRERDPHRMVKFLRDAEFIGQRTFLPASLILIVTAFWMVGEGNLDWDLWIILAIIGWAATLVTGAGFLGPETGRISRLIETEGEESPEVQRRIGRVLAISRVDLVVLVLVVIDMVIKPGT
jgi:uncharacterized membrane protein